ncbi:DoxX family protein [Staphylococcus lutrae]|uniref:DoxX family protein n=1 Tax=Staphylococcus lutrae TaxID=155085 RepID=A0AAC9RTC1_9STAP|nr:DoxX family protein [Staphylococcus lutrae]ARJ50769.1 hypothetical protein B5P37_05270 [Staphylococcus lutrae]PNZ36126.1 hypothetical protein CD134_08170 [Staphylococcus lutrae]
MLLNHVINAYVARDIIKSGLPKVKSDEKMATELKEAFNIDRELMQIAGIFEVVGSILLLTSSFGKAGIKLVRLGAIMINIIMGVAMFQHLKAGHGVKSTQAAGKYFLLNTLTLIDSFKK